MKIRRNGLSGESRGSFFQEGHLTDDALLLCLDGELSQAEAEAVDSHIHSCWSCRARSETISRGIADLADFQNAFLAPHLPPSSAGKAVFMARLDDLAGKLGRPSSLRSWRRVIEQFFRSLFPARPIWLAALLLIAVALPFSYLFNRRQVLSSDELLNRVMESEENALRSVPQPVVVQKVRIRTKDHVIIRTVYRDVSRRRVASRTDVSATQEETARNTFARTGLDWDNPLSADRYRKWRETQKVDWDVVRQAGRGFVRLDTKAQSGFIAEASLTIRISDYHTVEERLLLRDDSRIEIAELSSEVVGLAAINPEVFGAAATLPIPSHRTIPAPAHNPGDDAQLAITEVQVRSALHNLGADLGEQIDIRPTVGGYVLVNGIAGDKTRKEQLLAVLEKIPLTQARIETIAEAALQQQTGHASATSGHTTVATVAGGPPLLEGQLNQRFPDKDQRSAYVNQVLAMAQGASARAWALNRLAERYSPQQVALLDAPSRQNLGALLGDHITALRADVGRLQNQLGPVLSPASNTAAANTSSADSAVNFPKPGDQADDWRYQVHRVHSSTETVNESVAALLASSATDITDSPKDIEVGLRTTLTQLQVELQHLDQQVRKLF